MKYLFEKSKQVLHAIFIGLTATAIVLSFVSREARAVDMLETYTIDLSKSFEAYQHEPLNSLSRTVDQIMGNLLLGTQSPMVTLQSIEDYAKEEILRDIARRMYRNEELPKNFPYTSIRKINLSKLILDTEAKKGTLSADSILKDLIDRAEATKTLLALEDASEFFGGTTHEGSSVTTSKDVSVSLVHRLASGYKVLAFISEDEKKKKIDPKNLLKKSFEQITGPIVTKEDALKVLETLKPHLESKLKTRITFQALKAARDFAFRFMTQQNLIGNSINLIEKAAAELALKNSGSSGIVQKLRLERSELDSEKNRLKDEPGLTNRRKMRVIDEKLFTINQKLIEAQNQCEACRTRILPELRKLEKELIDLEDKYIEAEELRKSQDKLNEIDQQIKIKEASIAHKREELSQYEIDTRVTQTQVSKVVSRLKNIPVEKLNENEMEKLLRLEQGLEERVKGQPHVIHSIAKTIRTAKAGLADPKRPKGKFLFVGPSGVGKTEIAKALASFFSGNEDEKESGLVPIDMAEYQEKNEYTKLIGSAPGFVGYEEGGVLTEAINKNPYAVVLFDEIEKAHPDIALTLMALLDEGRIRDGKGRVFDASNITVIFTSNAGLEQASKAKSTEEADAIYDAAIRRFLRPELINRIDAIIPFHQLTPEVVVEIAEMALKKLNSRLESNSMYAEQTPPVVKLTTGALTAIAEIGYCPIYGARNLQREFQKVFTDQISHLMLSKALPAGSIITIDAEKVTQPETENSEGFRPYYNVNFYSNKTGAKFTMAEIQPIIKLKRPLLLDALMAFEDKSKTDELMANILANVDNNEALNQIEITLKSTADSNVISKFTQQSLKLVENHIPELFQERELVQNNAEVKAQIDQKIEEEREKLVEKMSVGEILRIKVVIPESPVAADKDGSVESSDKQPAEQDAREQTNKQKASENSQSPAKSEAQNCEGNLTSLENKQTE